MQDCRLPGSELGDTGLVKCPSWHSGDGPEWGAGQPYGPWSGGTLPEAKLPGSPSRMHSRQCGTLGARKAYLDRTAERRLMGCRVCVCTQWGCACVHSGLSPPPPAPCSRSPLRESGPWPGEHSPLEAAGPRLAILGRCDAGWVVNTPGTVKGSQKYQKHSQRLSVAIPMNYNSKKIFQSWLCTWTKCAGVHCWEGHARA